MDADQSIAHDCLSTNTPLRRRRYGAAMLILAAGFTLAISNTLLAADDDPSVQQRVAVVNQLLADGKTGQAAKALRRLDDEIQQGQNPEEDLTFALALTARAFEQAKDTKQAAEFYVRSVRAAGRESASQLPQEKINLIRLTAASTLARTADYEGAMAALRPVLLSSDALAEERKNLALQLTLHVASQSLSAGDSALAEQAYDLVSQHGDKPLRATAMLGAGWAAAMQKSKPKDASEKLESFVNTFPDHDDAPRAAALAITCMRQAGTTDKANELLEVLLERWPESAAASDAIGQWKLGDQLLPAAKTWLLNKSSSPSQIQEFSADLLALALVQAATSGNEEAWDSLTKQLAATDSVGQATSDLLQHLSKQKLDASGQRLAALLIAPPEGADTHAACREAACRWAGRNQLWTMLALASESCDPNQLDASRTVAIERLFAESLMQTGRPGDAQKWWIHLVDQRNVQDFPTLLRCAETATSLLETGPASERIEAARLAAGGNPARIALVDMLAADLAIRRLRFDEARSILEKVIQSSQSVATLRGRAQWMIGEIYFLQQKFPEAIEAYRRVEGLDPNGPWVEVALVQAGKSFEQLGRKHEATVCYSSLLSRFANSRHTSVARKRLAAIAPGQNAPESNSSNETIRR